MLPVVSVLVVLVVLVLVLVVLVPVVRCWWCCWAGGARCWCCCWWLVLLGCGEIGVAPAMHRDCSNCLHASSIAPCGGSRLPRGGARANRQPYIDGVVGW